MVDINVPNNQSISISTPQASSLTTSTSSGNIGANTNADAQLAYSWAVGVGLIQGIDYSAKHYAQEARAVIENPSFINVASSLDDITAVADDLTNIDILAESISTYHNLLLYEEIE